MSQIRFGLNSILSLPVIYNSVQNILGAERARRRFVGEHLPVKPGQSLLDIGCGTAEILRHLPGVDYLGFDPNSRYIDHASNRFGGDRFEHADLSTFAPPPNRSFDWVLAFGILHHLADDEAGVLLRLARDVLKFGGSLVTIDACYTDPQSGIARFLIANDRGQHVRTAEEYRDLVQGTFSDVECGVRTDLLYIPYTHLIMRCRKDPAD